MPNMGRPFEATSKWIAAGTFAHDSFITQRHKIYAFTLPTLLSLLQLQSAGNTISPFQIHPMTKASLFGTLGY